MRRLPLLTALALLSLPALAGKPVDLREAEPTDQVGVAMLIANVNMKSWAGESIRDYCIQRAYVTAADGTVYDPYAVRCYKDVGGITWFNGLPPGTYTLTQFFLESDKKYPMDEPGSVTFEVKPGAYTFVGDFLVTLEIKAMGSYKAHTTERLDPSADAEKASLAHEVFVREFDPKGKKNKP
ncbi:MAG: hypothetical protein JXB39_15670, partial [Deltaproteobacteria bacterium]|nr:hypothetical protein [Deltaproteobacteria bacterium]